MFEPEDFLETLDHMIELNLAIMEDARKEHDEECVEEVMLDLSRLRDLHERIRIQFGIDPIIRH